MKHSYKLTSYRRLYLLLDWSTQNHEKNHDSKKVVKIGYWLIRVHNSSFSLLTIIIVHGLNAVQFGLLGSSTNGIEVKPLFYT